MFTSISVTVACVHSDAGCAPSLQAYYYNTRTKETSWDQPTAGQGRTIAPQIHATNGQWGGPTAGHQEPPPQAPAKEGHGEWVFEFDGAMHTKGGYDGYWVMDSDIL